jgi:hypothetical protein
MLTSGVKPAKTKRNQRRPRRKPPSDVQLFVRDALATFGAKPESVPHAGDPPEVWQAWRWARAEETVPLYVLDHAVALMLALLEPGPSGAKRDPGVDRALRLAQYVESKALVARAVATSEEWHRLSPQAWKQIRALERRQLTEGVDLVPNIIKILKELHKDVDGNIARRAQRIKRAMNPSRRAKS